MENNGDYSVLIRESHLDTFGHVNNATYLSLYEEARWNFITARGFGMQQIMQRQQGPTILEVNVKFMKEIKLREIIKIDMELLNYKGKIGQLKQKMIREDGTIASEAIFTIGFFDLKERRLIEPTPEWNKAIGRVL